MVPGIPAGGGVRALVLPWLHARGKGIVVGDVVAALSPRTPGDRVIKRVVGLGGDWVAVGDGEKSVLVGFLGLGRELELMSIGSGGLLLPRRRQPAALGRLAALRTRAAGPRLRQGLGRAVDGGPVGRRRGGHAHSVVEVPLGAERTREG